MTSYAATSSTILPGAVPATPSGTVATKPAHAAPGGLLHVGTGSRAVRFGLGVAIAGLLAGDVYAILRSPVSEGASSRAASAAADGALGGSAGRAGAAGASWSGTPVMPFSETAYAASLVPPSSLGTMSAAPSAPLAAVPAASAPALVAPALPAPSAVDLPALTNPGTNGPATDPGSPAADAPAPAPPADSPLAPVLAVVESIPAVGPPVAEAVEQATAPANETSSATEVVSTPASTVGTALLP